MTETLTCAECNEDWEREVKRGRKPTTCPDCKNKPSEPVRKTKPVANEKLKEAERKYTQRVQVKGGSFKLLGDPKPYEGASGSKLTIYPGFEFDEGLVHTGSIVRQKGFSDRYKFRSLAVRPDGTAYANLVGVSGTYEGKYRAIGIGELTL